MEPHLRAKGTHFYTIGLSYKKADAEIRGHFSIDDVTKKNILLQAKKQDIDTLLVTSTCNRTELHGFAEHPYQLIKLLCEHTHGTVEEFEKVAYIHKNEAAIDHLFRVGTGLDSQILGDFEIISQIKKSFAASKKVGTASPYLERLVNAVIQASKKIKNETQISSGATSVSFAAVQYIMARVPYVSDKNLLLFGTGKIGRNTCENLIKHTQNDHIVLINRTKDKAQKIAGKFNLLVKDYANIQSEIKNADVLIVATGSQKPTISKSLIHSDKPLLILDLSIPRNVDLDVKELDNVTLVHLDDLSKMTDKTLERRKEYIPQAEGIIAEIKGEFDQWIETRKFAPTIKALKEKFTALKEAEISSHKKKNNDFDSEQVDVVTSKIIQKITNHFANHLRDNSSSNRESLALIQEIFKLQNK